MRRSSAMRDVMASREELMGVAAAGGAGVGAGACAKAGATKRLATPRLVSEGGILGTRLLMGETSRTALVIMGAIS